MAEHGARIKAHEDALKAGKADPALAAEHKNQAAQHREHARHHKVMAKHHADVMEVVKRIERLTGKPAH
jgi:hypothetical protein